MFGVEVLPTAGNGRVDEKRGTRARANWRGNERMSRSTMLDPFTTLTSCHVCRFFDLRSRIETCLMAVEIANLSVFAIASYRRDCCHCMYCVVECAPTLMKSGNAATVVQRVAPTLKLDGKYVSDEVFLDVNSQQCCICMRMPIVSAAVCTATTPASQSHCKSTPNSMAERTRSGCRRII